MYSGYGYYSGVEIWNNERVMAYLRGAPNIGVRPLKLPSLSLSRNCGCPTILPYVCDPGPLPSLDYVSASIDPAPWFDPAVPESADFAGLFVEEVTPFDSVVDREARSGAIQGGSLGPLRLGPRTFTVTGWLMARTCCAAEYGLRWLNEALAQTQGCVDCSLGDFYMLKCCPPPQDECRLAPRSIEAGQPTVQWNLTVVEASPGIFDITIDDSEQANVLSDPLAGENNASGALMDCVFAGGIGRLLIQNIGSGSEYYLTFDGSTITAGPSGPSGVGYMAQFTFDTTISVSCPEEQQAIYSARGALQRYIADTGGSGTVFTLGSIECMETRTGAPATDMVRVMHRTGLVSGPKVVDRFGTCCSNCGCTMLRVQFTMASESPYIFSDIMWCASSETFPDEEFCLDLDRICEDDCAETIGTQLVEQQVARPTCGVTLRYDGSWCASGWDPAEECPPPDCLIDIVGIEESAGSVEKTQSSGNKPCYVTLLSSGKWTGDGWDPADGMPPVACDLRVGNLVDCAEIPDPDTSCPSGRETRQIRIIWDGCSGVARWEPIRWTGSLFDACKCYTIAEIVVTEPPEEVADCEVPRVCPVDIRCGLAYRPWQMTSRQSAAVFFYRYSGSPPFVPPTTPTFSDVPKTNNFYLEIEWCANVGILDGFGDGTFRPALNISRRELAVGHYRAAGSPPFVPPGVPTFSDVGLAHPSYLEIEWVANQGIMVGSGSGTFRPTNPISRRDTAVTFYRADGSPVFSPPLIPSFIDVPNSDTAYTAIEWFYSQGITTGFGTDPTWEPIGWTHDPCAPFPSPGCEYVVGLVNGVEQETGPVTQVIEIPDNVFVPDCGPLPVVPPPPFFPSTSCYCEPLRSKRLCCTFENPAQWNDATSVIQVNAGSGELRNLRIAAYLNQFADQGYPCPCDPNDEFWRCRQPCASIEVPQLPPGATLTIDSRTRISTVRLINGTVVNGMRFLESSGSTIFDWFDVAPCSTFCIVASVDAGVADDATVSIGIVGRFLASGG